MYYADGRFAAHSVFDTDVGQVTIPMAAVLAYVFL